MKGTMCRSCAGCFVYLKLVENKLCGSEEKYICFLALKNPLSRVAHILQPRFEYIHTMFSQSGV